MQFTINQVPFLALLQDVCNVVERNQTLPILSNILIKLNNNKLTCVSTDLEIEINSSTEVDFPDSYQFTLPARKMLDIVKALPAGIVLTISVKDKQAIISTTSSQYTFTLLSEITFPVIQSEAKVFNGSLELEAKVLKALINATQFCMAAQDIRYYLNGLFVCFNATNILAIATDGHRLAKYDLAAEGENKSTVELLLPYKSVMELSRVIPMSEEIIKIEFNEKLCSVSFREYSFVSKLIDSNYPDYQRVYPTLETSLLTVNRLELKEALSRAVILTNKKVSGVRLNISSDTMIISAQNPEQEKAKESVAINYNGTELETGFNVGYFVDILNHLSSEEIEIHLGDADSGCILKSKDNEKVEYVLMPIKF